MKSDRFKPTFKDVKAFQVTIQNVLDIRADHFLPAKVFHVEHSTYRKSVVVYVEVTTNSGQKRIIGSSVGEWFVIFSNGTVTSISDREFKELFRQGGTGHAEGNESDEDELDGDLLSPDQPHQSRHPHLYRGSQQGLESTEHGVGDPRRRDNARSQVRPQ
jgi:hypothetical protein